MKSIHLIFQVGLIIVGFDKTHRLHPSPSAGGQPAAAGAALRPVHPQGEGASA